MTMTIEARSPYLWSTTEMRRPSADRPAWADTAFRDFEKILLSANEDYPCHFGVQAQQQGHNWFAVLESASTDSDYADLTQLLRRFRNRAWTGPKRQSLIVFHGPPGHIDLHRDRDEFWRTLTQLSRHDVAPWPADVPRDARDPRWQWCFDGEPWFVFALSPGYRNHRSRSVTACLALVFQTQRVFAGMSGTTRSGQAAKQLIRQRLHDFDGIAPHPHLGTAESSSSYKWRQYFLTDDNCPLPVQACPFSR